MKWFDNWIAKKYHQAQSGKLSPSPQATVVSNVIGANGLNLSVYKADGGTVIEFRQYDYKTDRHVNSLHVITDQDNFAERLSQIITLELMKQGMS